METHTIFVLSKALSRPLGLCFPVSCMVEFCGGGWEVSCSLVTTLGIGLGFGVMGLVPSV